jgi:hypothetical protein
MGLTGSVQKKKRNSVRERFSLVENEVSLLSLIFLGTSD